MMSKTHIAVGLLTGIAITKVAANYNFDYFEYVPGIILGSTMPDIDTGQSWAAQVVPFVDDLLRKTGILKHRGFTHGITGIFFILGIFLMIRNCFMFAFTIGYISHCLLDMLTSKVKITCKHDNAIYKLTWVLIIFSFFIKF